jgi:hypothetical protein
MWKSKHTGLNRKVRSALEKRHPVTGDVIETIPAIRAEFGFATGEQRITDPLTGEFTTLEGFQGGFFDLDAVAEQKGWDDDIKEMVARSLDELERQQPQTLQSVDYIVPPAPKPWPTYDAESDPEKLVSLAAELGLATRALAYERENRERADVITALEAQLKGAPEPDEPQPVVATATRAAEEPLLPVEGIPRVPVL